MSVDVPTSIWRRTSGNGELGETSDNLVTLSSLQIVTLAGSDLVVLAGSYTPVPATEWVADDPVPVSIWQPTCTEDEFTDGDVYDIADSSGDLLVDTTGDSIVDTGVVQTPLAATDWAEDDSI
jgi:hypothetical protein